MPRSVPQVAQVEDYDSDGSCVKPHTRKEARRRTTTSGPPKALSRYRNGHKDGASDSGYSSHTSGTQASNSSATARPSGSMAPPPRPATAHGQTKPKPVIHSSESQQSRPKPPSRSASISRQNTGQCEDRNCRHATCLAARNPERRYSISQQYSPQYAQYSVPPSPVQYQQATTPYQYQYAQVPQVSTPQAVPTLAAQPQPRPRSGSNSRQARPVSIHGYPFPNSYNATQQGPPPANSAYQNIQAAWAQYNAQQAQQQAYQQAYQAAYGSTPPNQAIPVYPQASPITTSPTSQNYPMSGLQRTYSARVAQQPNGYDLSKMQTQPNPLQRTTSLRQPSARVSTMPGAYPDPESSETDSDSDDSSSEMSEAEYERERRARARDSRLMSSSSSSQRRPSIKRQYATAPVLPTSSREQLRRNLRSDHLVDRLDSISSSDNMDSDRTARAVVNKPRTTYTDSSRSSRRPSVSTTASSGRTKDTQISSAASGMASLVLEDKTGRRISYLSKRDQETLRRQFAEKQYEAEQRRQIEAYQDAVRGATGPELTAENIRMQQLRSSGSVSGRSRKSSRSASKAPAGPGQGIKIESGGTVIHVYGDSKIEMRAGEDGGPAQLFIGGGPSGKDSAYHGSSSKSSSSRVGRSHGGSDVGGRRRSVIPEERGMEQPTA